MSYLFQLTPRPDFTIRQIFPEVSVIGNIYFKTSSTTFKY